MNNNKQCEWEYEKYFTFFFSWSNSVLNFSSSSFTDLKFLRAVPAPEWIALNQCFRRPQLSLSLASNAESNVLELSNGEETDRSVGVAKFLFCVMNFAKLWK